jgi:hypothetical protein
MPVPTSWGSRSRTVLRFRCAVPVEVFNVLVMRTDEGRYAVDTEGLARHAREVATVGACLENASKYAQPLPSGAFGLVGQLFAANLIETSGVASAAIARLGTHARADQAALYATLSDYLAHESRTERALATTCRRGPDRTVTGQASAEPTSAGGGYVPGTIRSALDDPGAPP